MRVIHRMSAVPVLDLYHFYRSGRCYIRDGVAVALAKYNRQSDRAKAGCIRTQSSDLGFSMDVENIAFTAKDLRLENDIVLADIYILDTPSGNLVYSIAKQRGCAFQLVAVTSGPSDKTFITTAVRVEAFDKSRKEGTMGTEVITAERTNGQQACADFMNSLAEQVSPGLKFTFEINEPYHDTGMWFIDITKLGMQSPTAIMQYIKKDDRVLFGVSAYTEHRTEVLELAPSFAFNNAKDAAQKTAKLLEKA